VWKGLFGKWEEASEKRRKKSAGRKKLRLSHKKRKQKGLLGRGNIGDGGG